MQHTMESLLVQLLVEVADPKRMDKGIPRIFLN